MSKMQATTTATNPSRCLGGRARYPMDYPLHADCQQRGHQNNNNGGLNFRYSLMV